MTVLPAPVGSTKSGAFLPALNAARTSAISFSWYGRGVSMGYNFCMLLTNLS